MGLDRFPSSVDIENVSLAYPNARGREGVKVLERVSLRISAGSFVCVIGPSGCGKSTLLSLTAGYLAPSEGRVLMDGNEIRGPGPDRLMVFQHPTLFPWHTAAANVAFGLNLAAHKDKRGADVKPAVDHFLSLVGLKEFADRYPFELSGGMRQRVEIARALAVDPRVLLMDEPFGALDALTRLSMQREMLKIWEHTKKTVIFVTHDISEAVILADQVVVMTPRPAGVKEVVEVVLPRPRSRDDKAVTEVSHHIAALLDATF